MRRLMYWIGGLLLVYVVIVVLAYLAQDMLVFPGASMSDSGIEQTPPPGVKIFRLDRLGGESFRVAQYAPPEPVAVMLFFVGNGENLLSAVARSERMSRYGMLTVVPEYPGYGASEGSPSEKSLMEAADAAAAHAMRLAQDGNLPFVVGGSSLGTFCAVHIAAQGVATRLLLKAPPTRLVDTASTHYRFLPVRLLLRHRFDNMTPAPRVTCPVMIVHGEDDAIVPVAMGRELAQAFGGAVEIVELPGLDHNDPALSPDGPAGDRIRAFLQKE